jgi:hypothetical protein
VGPAVRIESRHENREESSSSVLVCDFRLSAVDLSFVACYLSTVLCSFPYMGLCIVFSVHSDCLAILRVVCGG